MWHHSLWFPFRNTVRTSSHIEITDDSVDDVCLPDCLFDCLADCPLRIYYLSVDAFLGKTPIKAKEKILLQICVRQLKSISKSNLASDWCCCQFNAMLQVNSSCYGDCCCCCSADVACAIVAVIVGCMQHNGNMSVECWTGNDTAAILWSLAFFLFLCFCSTH